MSVLALNRVGISRGGRQVVADVTFQMDRGTITALTGASGTGKTTVLRAIAGLEPATEGSIHTSGRVGMVFQFHHLFANMRALQNVSLAPVHVDRVPAAEAEAKARQLLDLLGVGHRAEAFPHELSGGEAQRVAIARALAVDPALLLMDEPTASLDPARRGELAATFTQLAARGRAILVATHDVDFVRACADRVVVLEDGRVAREGAPGKVF